MISYVVPTRDRPEALARTLAALGGLRAPHRDDEVIVVDDASAAPAVVPPVLANGMPTIGLRLRHAAGAAARNAAARRARGAWLVMLDDDSAPIDEGHVEALADAPVDVAAIGAEILLPGGVHDFGGLPEVFVGCGVAIRRDVFLDLGGYDRSFGLYAEEYDLAARMIAAGFRITHDWRFRVHHAKVARHRDMNGMMRRLVRNSGWVLERYAPRQEREAAMTAMLERCIRVAARERAVPGFRRGLQELRATAAAQPRRALSKGRWDRFTGAARIRATLTGLNLSGGRVAMVDEGKGVATVRSVLTELECRIADDAVAQVIGTISPGPMVDAWRARASAIRIILPWRPTMASDDG